MKSSDVFPSSYLKAADIKGQEPIVTIASVVMEELQDGKKPVAHFVGKEKGLVLNRTNWGMLEHLYGDESDDWAGCKIQLFTAMTTDQHGKPVLGLRVKAPPTQNGGSPPQEKPPHQHTSHQVGRATISTTRAIGDELPSDEIPF
jgi:hypothetical protein